LYGNNVARRIQKHSKAFTNQQPTQRPEVVH
jgi:hypothetical protein